MSNYYDYLFVWHHSDLAGKVVPADEAIFAIRRDIEGSEPVKLDQFTVYLPGIRDSLPARLLFRQQPDQILERESGWKFSLVESRGWPRRP